MRHITLLLVALVLLPPEISFAATSVPRNSFVRKCVSSVGELASHINRDAVVRNRFARHFGVPPAQVATYIRDNVTITKITSAKPRRVYICARSGRFTAQRKVLRPGTAVFALKDTGEPLLIMSCGNPMVSKLPLRRKTLARQPQEYRVLRLNEAPPPPPALVAALSPPSAPQPEPPPLAAVPSPEGGSPVTAAPVTPAKRRLNPLPLLGLLGLHRHHHHGPPPPIPEPAGAAAVVATVVLPAMGWTVRRIRSRRTDGKPD